MKCSTEPQRRQQTPWLRLRLFCVHAIASRGGDLLMAFSSQATFTKWVTVAQCGEALKANVISTITLNATMLSLLLGGLLGIDGTVDLEDTPFDQFYLCMLGIANSTCL